MSPFDKLIEKNDEFRQIFHQLPERKIIIRANDPTFTIDEVTDSYLEVTGLQRSDLIGKPYFTVFPDVSERYKKSGVSHMAEVFRKVILTKKPQVQRAFRYDLPNPKRPGEYIEHHWRTTHYPVFAVDGKVSHILQVSRNATNEVFFNREAKEAKLLQKRNEELQELGRSKDEFVALASHQLRTPATAVKQYLGMVLQGYVGPVDPVQEELLTKAFESNERQIQIINQILNAARADTGKLIMTPGLFDLNEMMRVVTDELRHDIEARGHAFTVVRPETPVQVRADIGYLRMAIENLINNARVYTPDGGRIAVKLSVSQSKAHISVQDTGVGIRKSDMSKLFAKFSRIHNELSVQAGGSGIGLYLAAEIVRLHGGSIDVDSKIKKGTTFTIHLPLARTKPRVVQAPRHITVKS